MDSSLRKFAFATWMLFRVRTGFAQNPAVTIQVDVNANPQPINSLIYGVAHASTTVSSDLNSPLNQNGGTGSQPWTLAMPGGMIYTLVLWSNYSKAPAGSAVQQS
jgi:hypothetical protein